MIGKDEQYLRKLCPEYEKVENYEQAVADDTQIWDLHHRNGICIARKELKRLGLYFKRPAGELMFLTHAEHRRLHNMYILPATRKKLSDAIKGENNPNYGRTGENSPLHGKHHSADVKKRISEATKGENNPMYGRTGENNPQFGRHWWNNGITNKRSKECPGEGFVEGRLKRNPNK